MPPKKIKFSAAKPTPPANIIKRSIRRVSSITSSHTIADPSQINTDLFSTTQPVSNASNPLIDYDQLTAAIVKQQQQVMPSTSNPSIDDTCTVQCRLQRVAIVLFI